MDSLARVVGWVAVALIVSAGVVPLATRLRTGRRAVPGSSPIAWHVILGFSASAAALAHALVSFPSLGDPAAVGGGAAALIPAAAAFLLLVAHAGLGLQLREPRLRDRAKKRRAHAITAMAIVVTVGAHVVALLRAR